jgi:hypothetical protein
MAKEREEKIRQLNEVLRKWRGADAQLWSYTASLATLEIRLFFEQLPGNLYLVCSPCESIAGPVCWKRCELSVGEDHSEDGLFLVQDKGAGFRLLCHQLHTFENDELLFGPREERKDPDV